MASAMTLTPVGVVRNSNDGTWIDIEPSFRDAMVGLGDFSHIYVFFWFHENTAPEDRTMLKVHPCRNPDNPLTGVFATHSPRRPNLIGMTLCRIASIDKLRIHLVAMDALDGSPVVDIKCYIPPDTAQEPCRVPSWA